MTLKNTLSSNLDDFPLSVLLLRLESSVSLLIISGKFNLSSQDLQQVYFCPNILVLNYFCRHLIELFVALLEMFLLVPGLQLLALLLVL